jgi:hypothetical protein
MSLVIPIMPPQRRTLSTKTAILHPPEKMSPNGTRRSVTKPQLATDNTHVNSPDHLSSHINIKNTDNMLPNATLHDIEITKLTRKYSSWMRSHNRIWNNPMSTQYLNVYQRLDLSLSHMLKNPPGKQMKGSTYAEHQEQKRNCVLIERKNAVWCNEKREKLMQYLPDFVGEKLALEVESELQKLVLAQAGELEIPINIARYDGFEEWKRATLPLDTPCGEIRLSIDNMRGHTGRPVPTADFAGKGYKTESAMTFRRSDAITQLSTILSLTLAAIDKPIFDELRGHVLAVKKEFGTLVGGDRCPVQCFVGIFVLVNVFTREHVDTDDMPDAWAAMAVFGKFKGATLYVPQLGAQIPYERRDVVYIRSRLLRHFSEEFEVLAEGGRYVLVFTNHESVFKYLSEHYRLVFRE